MATKVLDLDLERLPASVDGLEGYEHALIIFRYRGRPVGRERLPVCKGRISSADLVAASVLTDDWYMLEQRLLRDYLEWDEVDINLPAPEPESATVAVCTRDRPKDIERCLDAFMRMPDDGQEFLVVDNCPSSDDTKQIVARYGDRVRYVREEKQGLNNARNRAVKEAKHDIVAFNDDDAVPDPDWLRALIRDFRDPLVVCVTGLTMPLELETEAQEWFERISPFQRGFKRVIFDSEKIHPLSAHRVGAGANMALRRSVFDLVGPFDPALDVGTPTRSGGDTEMFARILESGYRIVYEPAALSWHRHRRDWEDLRNTIFGYGTGVYANWAKQLLRNREFAVFLYAWFWLFQDQLPGLVRSLLRWPGSVPLDLVLAELRGCVAGPIAYARSRRIQQKRIDRGEQTNALHQCGYTNS